MEHTHNRNHVSRSISPLTDARDAVPSIGKGEPPGIFHVAEEAVRGGKGRVLGHEIAVHRPRRQPLQQFRPLVRTRHEPRNRRKVHFSLHKTRQIRLKPAKIAHSLPSF